MICGSKCFLVEVEQNGDRQIKKVHARSPINARKVIKGELGKQAVVITVKAEKGSLHP